MPLVFWIDGFGVFHRWTCDDVGADLAHRGRHGHACDAEAARDAPLSQVPQGSLQLDGKPGTLLPRGAKLAPKWRKKTSRHRRPLASKATRTRTEADVHEDDTRARGRFDVQVDKLRDMFEKNRHVVRDDERRGPTRGEGTAVSTHRSARSTWLTHAGWTHDPHQTDPNLIDELIEQGEKKLHAGRHPDPYVVPYYVGGTKYARNPPVPPEMRLVFDYGREVQP